jgi:hypothetical protein
MPTKDSQLEKVGAVLEKSLKRLELGTRLDEYGVWPVWNEVVGAPIARNAQPEKIRNGTLFVRVTSPVWKQQLQYMKEMIAEKLNGRLRAGVVKNIFFVVGGLAPMDPVKSPTTESVDDAPAAEPASDEFLETIDDPEIRQAFKKLLKSYRRRAPRSRH